MPAAGAWATRNPAGVSRSVNSRGIVISPRQGEVGWPPA